ncbi:hypothetical protein OIO90_004730 [Microbotryomycetes sp. JL221]|nr:hypothetical protein OIO90_004730 [Microbotryomycetes sp. JL221]
MPPHPFTAGPLFSLTGQVALVTGGGTGIGYMIARALAANGCKTYITGRRVEKLEAAVESAQQEGELQATIVPIQMDVTDKSSIKKVVDEISSKENLVNNAGIAKGTNGTLSNKRGDINEYSETMFKYEPDVWTDVMKTNVLSPWFVTAAFLPLLHKAREHKSPAEGAAVINVTSISGITKTSQNGQHIYNSSKAAIVSLTNQMASELYDEKIGIRVNSLAPGLFMSEMTSGGRFPDPDDREAYLKRGIPAGRPGLEREMAQSALAIACNHFVWGQHFVMDVIPVGFKRRQQPAYREPSLCLENDAGHTFNIHAVSSSIVRVVHELPRSKYPQKTNDGVHWEAKGFEPTIVDQRETYCKIQFPTFDILVDHANGPRLQFVTDGQSLLADSSTRAYSFDKTTGAVWHYVERENYLPVDENEYTLQGKSFVHPERNEFVYGLGESRGSLEKTGKKYTMEGRDALSYDFEQGDPLYKVTPFYSIFNRKLDRWIGVCYNTLADSSFDMGAEGDVLFGCFRSYKANAGPLDYYVMFGDGTLSSIMTEYASLTSPKPSASSLHAFASSPSLPPLSQFGYLASSLSLAAEPKAQESIIGFVKQSRQEGFPIDGLYLSSGWCQNEETDNRHYFAWNRARYPDPQALGRIIESELEVQTIVNIKPWLLLDHPFYPSAVEKHKSSPGGVFVKCAADRQQEEPLMRDGNQVDLVWTSGFAAHGPGSYFDYSSIDGSQWWIDAIKNQLLDNGLTGMWIDNNEMAGMVDDEATFAGEVGLYRSQIPTGLSDDVEKRAGWGGGSVRAGSVGKAIQTMGMARATYEALLSSRPNERPVIVSRSGVPGIQAYAHATWSGDNSTSWKALKWGTKMTLSVGMSFGPGLYGHDIGGFAGKHHPSPELLVRWCQNGAWHTRFTVHSWKQVSTTMWMYRDQPEVAEILRQTLDLRYRLAPTFYSLYVTHYYRRGWPVLKPLLWYHSIDPYTLKLDEEFIFGTHVLVAPVTDRGATTREVYLPSHANDGEVDLMWCELETGRWHHGSKDGSTVTVDAPLSSTPVLVRAGGALMLGGRCSRNIYDGIRERTLLIFPGPTGHSSGQTGSLTLVEDDFKTNDHVDKNIYSELNFMYKHTMPAVPKNSTILLTGASGYLAAHVGRQLLQAGYTVRGTVRSDSKGQYLKNLYEAEGLTKFEYVIVEDVEPEGAFDEAVKGVDGIAHTASPFHFRVEDPHRDLINPAVRGTLSVLNSASKESKVQRIVITSSFASIVNPRDPVHTFNEEEWNEYSPKQVEEKGKDCDPSQSYRASKVLAEKSAWKFVKDHNSSFDITTICPPLILGPIIHDCTDSKSLNTSCAGFNSILRGEKKADDAVGFSGFYVDVRDVAKIHVDSLGNKAAGGERFVVSHDAFNWQLMLDVLFQDDKNKELAAKFPNAEKGHPGVRIEKDKTNVLDASKAKKVFGWEPMPLEKTVLDMAQSFADKLKQ